MTRWLVTFDVGTDDEACFEYGDDALLRVIKEHVILADVQPDGNVVMIRKADYLNTKPVSWSGTVTGRMTHDKSFIEEVPRLTLIRGGIED